MPSLYKCFVRRNPSRQKRTSVVNARTDKFDVYIGHAILGARAACMIGNSPFACPFQVPGQPLTPDQLENFRLATLRSLTRRSPKWRNWLREVQGLRLGCWCKPGICHGDVLAEFADKLPSEESLLAIAKRSKRRWLSPSAAVRAEFGLTEVARDLQQKSKAEPPRSGSMPRPGDARPERHLYGG